MFDHSNWSYLEVFSFGTVYLVMICGCSFDLIDKMLVYVHWNDDFFPEEVLKPWHKFSDWFPFICLNNEMREFVWGYSISSRRSLYLLATLYSLLREVSPGVLFLCRIPPSPAQLEKNVMSNWREMIKVSRGIIANSGLNFFLQL